MRVSLRVRVCDVARFDVQDEQAIVRVRERDVRAVRRPLRLEVEGRVVDGDAALIRAVLICDDQCVFVLSIVEPRDLRSVRRPCGVPVGYARSSSQIAP